MSETTIVRTTTVFVVPIIFVFAMHLLVHGHNAPGGGFVAGLLGVAALVLLLFADFRANVMRMPAVALCCAGVALTVCTGVVPIVFGKSFLTHEHGIVSTTLVFDIGVCAAVCGAGIAVVQAFVGDEEQGGS
jgi:multicomponent Na+:H+ antiporter subunit B